MTYLLRKFLNKFIILQTSNNQIFYGEVLAITRNILTLKGLKFPSCEHSDMISTYYIDTNCLIWFKEAYDCDEYSLLKNKVKSLKTPKNKEEFHKTSDLAEDIEKTANIFENLFENIETLIEIENENEKE